MTSLQDVLSGSERSGSGAQVSPALPGHSVLTISSVLAIPLTAEMQAGTRTSQGVYNKVSIVLVEVRTSDGVVGHGECLGRFGAPAYASFINEVLAPLLVGQNAFDIRRHWQRMRALVDAAAKGE